MRPSNNEIGGYFPLGLPCRGSFPHENGSLVNSGRHALEYILRSCPDIGLLWIPAYTCDSLLEPLRRCNIDYRTYNINLSLELAGDIRLGKGEYLLATNYFGLKDAYMAQLADAYGERLIIDNAQALNAPHLPGTYALYSPRKYTGLPDGGMACLPAGKRGMELLEQDISCHRCLHLLKRIDCGATAAYGDFKNSNEALSSLPLRRMSRLTEAMLRHTDFADITARRRNNFQHLHQSLRHTNRLSIPELNSFACPLVYPYWGGNPMLREHLIRNKVYVATYWPNVLRDCLPPSVEYCLAANLIPLPIDQRYGQAEMDTILTLVKHEE